jgi:dihydrofolate reductase
VTRDPAWRADGAEPAGSIEAALALVAGCPKAFVIGGAQLYAAAMPRADRLLITEIDRDYDGDTFMPAPDPGRWRETQREPHPPAGDRDFAFAYVTYEPRR